MTQLPGGFIEVGKVNALAICIPIMRSFWRSNSKTLTQNASEVGNSTTVP